MRIAVDIGFGFVKVMNENGTFENFPSVITRRTDSSLKGIVGGTGDDYSIIYWEVNKDGRENERDNEKKCYVGDAALTNGGTRKWEDKGEFNVEELKILIATAVGLVNPNNEDIDLCVGLPMSYYLQKEDELISVLKSIDARVSYFGKSTTSIIKFKTVFCFPQGAGAYYSAVFDRDGQIKNYDLATSSVGIIDIGYRTVDYLVMAKGRKGINMIDNLSGSLEEDGMNNVYVDIQNRLSLPEAEGGVGREIPLTEIEKALLWYGGKLDYRKQTINLLPFEEQAHKERAEEISSKLKIKWGVDGDMLSIIFITGGGGESLFDFLKEKFEQGELQDNSIYSNCEGYLGAQAMAINKMAAVRG